MELRLRPAALGDEQLLLEWRNDEEVRRQFFAGELVTPDEHARWLRARLADPSSVLYIAEVEGAAVGQARVDRTTDGAGEISVSVAPGQRGRGFGSQLIRLASRHALAELDLGEIVAVVKASNGPSLRAFRAAGFGHDEHAVRDLGPVVVLRLR